MFSKNPKIEAAYRRKPWWQRVRLTWIKMRVWEVEARIEKIADEMDCGWALAKELSPRVPRLMQERRKLIDLLMEEFPPEKFL